ncbi:hypothetical protein JOF41_004278 [Saccharothrix coeruleofusca]|uniref:DUF7711 family protein n=1 Tax=Saccharothrix coeruleofusca TaxID=33919 RepID=UPI001AE80601|nr:hypothetical protein [Saccharothrix coeruleofusca]MBP2338100.1 hypothetical protein [Saccharothrix coeruleofusca]
MKRTRAVHHLRELAAKCDEMSRASSSIFRLRVVQLWAVGEVLGSTEELDWVKVALVVDLPVDEVPWLGKPAGADHWAQATRLDKNPISPLWRSARAPVWNHRVERPVLVWDVENGVAEQTLTALAQGRGDSVRTPAPSAEELRERLDDELAVSLRALRHWTGVYEEKRWAPGKLTPISDAMWSAGAGYVDVWDALADPGN